MTEEKTIVLHGRPRVSTIRMRMTSVEPVFGQTKHARNITTFSRRGLQAAQHEWKLIAATHNLLKLHRAQPAT